MEEVRLRHMRHCYSKIINLCLIFHILGSQNHCISRQGTSSERRFRWQGHFQWSNQWWLFKWRLIWQQFFCWLSKQVLLKEGHAKESESVHLKEMACYDTASCYLCRLFIYLLSIATKTLFCALFIAMYLLPN